MNCLVCGEQVPAIGGTKLHNGKICKTCTSQLPSMLLKGSPYLQEYALKNAMEITKKNMDIFSATASFGELHIDEMHYMFAIAQSLDSNGKPKTGNNVFSVYDLQDVGLFCNSPRSDHGSVLVDVEFRCMIESLRLPISTTVKKSAKCVSKRVDSKHVEWDEPNDMAMFRSMFNRMLKTASERFDNYLRSKTVYAFELDKARSIFMLPEDYTSDDVKRARRLMFKVYHPDTNSDDDTTRESQIINNAYLLLMQDLEIRNKK